MPIVLTELSTAGGHPVLRAEMKGEVTVDEATAYHQAIIPGGKYELWGHLVTGNVQGVSADVRRVLGSRAPDPNNPIPVAVVLTSPMARMVASLVMRGSRNENNALFPTEAEGLAWLDGRLAEFHRRRQAPTAS